MCEAAVWVCELHREGCRGRKSRRTCSTRSCGEAAGTSSSERLGEGEAEDARKLSLPPSEALRKQCANHTSVPSACPLYL